MDAWEDVTTSKQLAVYLGQWTNWSRGPVFGATLTVTKRNGNLLIAFAAFFVTLIAARVWRMICLCCHQIYSSNEPKDAPYHQRQIILRNSPSPQSALWKLIQLGWVPRGTVARLVRNIILPILFALLCLAGFAGVTYILPLLSSSMGDEVLLLPGTSGWLNATKAFDNITEYNSLTQPLLANQVINAANYAQQCYSTGSTGILECNGFAENRIASTVKLDAPCPFDESMCRSKTSNIFLDTGYIDSHYHYGMNSRENERVLYRGTLQCAPLVTEGYTSTLATPTGNFTRYHHGKFRADSYTQTIADGIYMVQDLATQYSIGNLVNNTYPIPSANYKIDSFLAYLVNGSVADDAEYIPSPKLQRNDGDQYIVFLSGNGVNFAERSQDDWYRAVRPWKELARTSDPSAYDSYIFDDAASPLGCVQQFQFCQNGLPKGQQCSPLSSWEGASSVALDMAPSDAAALRLNWVRSQIVTSFLNDILTTLQASALTTQRSLRVGVQSPIQSNQWQTDVVSWWATMLAYTQSNFIDSVVGPSEKRLEQYISAPEDPAICTNQKIRSAAYMSFNIFGLYVLFLGGALVIAISYSIEPIISCLHRRRKYNQYKYLEWVSNESLQLHRLAHEGVGWGTWSRATEDIPATKKDEVLGCLDLTESLHPRIRPASSSDSESETETGYITDYVPDPPATSGTASTAQMTQRDTGAESPYFIHHDWVETPYTWVAQNPYTRFSNDSGGFPILSAYWPQTRSWESEHKTPSS